MSEEIVDKNHTASETSEVSKAQSEIVRKNIEAIAAVQRQAAEGRTPQERIADAITEFSGSMAFVYMHAFWFGVWILLNIGLLHIPHVSEFDPFPFGLLTLIVSLEAIFLSTFVLISQNRLAQVSERRAELDLQVNLLAEQKTAKILEMLDQVARELDGMSHRFNFTPDPEVEALKVSPEPREVLEVIEEAVKNKTEEVKEEVSGALKEITGEVEAIHTDVKRTSSDLQEVASDVEEIKEEIESREKPVKGNDGRGQRGG
ncbi:MAG TPA: DUF1003 domain-containing protein [Pyrinomonadaceae bacterium]|jgi:uncharacterized membrane protein